MSLRMPNWQIPLSSVTFGREERLAVSNVLKSKWVSMGPQVEAFEEEFARYVGVKHAIAVSSGTAALHLAYLILGIECGDEIIQPATNFVAAANMTKAVGATAVFADIISCTEPTIDPLDVEACISERTKAVVVMHYGGYPCRQTEIEKLCSNKGIAIIEDACHAIGARYLDHTDKEPNRRIGSRGDIACFSFFANKNIVVGEGGMLTTNEDDLAQQLRALRNHGLTSSTWQRHNSNQRGYDVATHGYNYRMDEIRAALGRVQLTKLDKNNRKRQSLTAEYQACFRDVRKFRLTFSNLKSESAYHLMAVVAEDERTRNEAVDQLHKQGIQTSNHYPSVTQLTAWKTSSGTGVDKSVLFGNLVITLPLHPDLRRSDVRRVCEVIAAI